MKLVYSLLPLMFVGCVSTKNYDADREEHRSRLEALEGVSKRNSEGVCFLAVSQCVGFTTLTVAEAAKTNASYRTISPEMIQSYCETRNQDCMSYLQGTPEDVQDPESSGSSGEQEQQEQGQEHP